MAKFRRFHFVVLFGLVTVSLGITSGVSAYVANYPLPDGVFESGALGYTWQETYVTA